MNLIEQLGLEKCKQIVDGAPEGGQGDQYIGVKSGWYYKRAGLNVFFWHMDEWCQLSDKFQAEMISIADLGTAIADHATDNLSHFDHCSDIRNHVSPNTVVVDHE